MSDARDTITLAHGGGGRATRSLIEGTILRHFGKPDPKGIARSRRIITPTRTSNRLHNRQLCCATTLLSRG